MYLSPSQRPWWSSLAFWLCAFLGRREKMCSPSWCIMWFLWLIDLCMSTKWSGARGLVALWKFYVGLSPSSWCCHRGGLAVPPEPDGAWICSLPCARWFGQLLRCFPKIGIAAPWREERRCPKPRNPTGSQAPAPGLGAAQPRCLASSVYPYFFTLKNWSPDKWGWRLSQFAFV